jgi:hypothetical protein
MILKFEQIEGFLKILICFKALILANIAVIRNLVLCFSKIGGGHESS